MILPLQVGLALILSAGARDSDVAAGLSLYQKLDYDRAVVALERALTKKDLEGEDRAKALETLGFAYTVLGDAANAERTFHALLDVEPRYAVDPDLSPRLRSAFVQAKASWIEGRRVSFEIASALADKELIGRIKGGDPERIGSLVARGDSGRLSALVCAGAECRGARPDEPFYVDVRDHSKLLLFTAGPFTPDVKAEVKDSLPTWWIWVGAGAAVVAGGVALGFALRKGDPPAGTLGRLQLP